MLNFYLQNKFCLLDLKLTTYIRISSHLILKISILSHTYVFVSLGHATTLPTQDPRRKLTPWLSAEVVETVKELGVWVKKCVGNWGWSETNIILKN